MTRYKLTSFDKHTTYINSDNVWEASKTAIKQFRAITCDVYPIEIVDELGNESALVWDKDAEKGSGDEIKLLHTYAQINLPTNVKLNQDERTALSLTRDIRYTVDRHVSTSATTGQVYDMRCYMDLINDMETLMRRMTCAIHAACPQEDKYGYEYGSNDGSEYE